MMLDAPLDQILLLGAALLVVGAIGGLIAGLLGVGGGIVIVPVLFHLFTSLGIDEGIRMQVAVGTSLATIIATSASSVRAHWRRGAVDTDLLRQWGPFILLGVLLGTALADYLRGPALTAVFATVGFIVSLNMGFGKAHWRLGDTLPTGFVRWLMAGSIGTVSAMMGIGGGTLSVPLLSLFGYPIHRAVGSAAAIGFIIGVPGAIGFIVTGWNEAALPPFSLGYVNLLGLALIVPTSMLLAPVGARLAHSLNTRKLRLAFAIFLAITAMRMAYSVIF